jgi:hypothetical protein
MISSSPTTAKLWTSSSRLQAMHNKYKIVNKGPVEYYLGVEISRDRSKRTLNIKQSKFI